MNIRVILIFTLLYLTSDCRLAAQSYSQSAPIALIIDADTANELDDLFAIVRALGEQRFDLRGITSAQFHISPLASDSSVHESQRINEDLLLLAGLTDIPLPMGSNEPLPSIEDPAPSEASKFIIDQARQMPAGQKLHIAILGPCTNVASALLEDPAIVDKIIVHYIGFWHDPKVNTYNKIEFNSGNDMKAVNLLLNTEGLDFNVMSATTCQHLVFDREDTFKKLADKGALADYLRQRWENHKRWWTKDDPEKLKWIMWDVAIIEALAHPEYAEYQSFSTPKENTAREIDIYTSIDVGKMTGDFWLHFEKLVNVISK